MSLDAQIIAEIEDELRRDADECAAHATRLRDKASEQFTDSLAAEYADESARRWRQLADAVSCGLFDWLEFERIAMVTDRQRPAATTIPSSPALAITAGGAA